MRAMAIHVVTAILGILGGSAAPQLQAAGGICHGTECRQPEYGRPQLFHNFYVPPTCGGLGAQLYLAPHPVPAMVGHTYYTYQPLLPHEMLYRHKRVYHRYYNEGRGLTRTSVRWW